MGRCLADSRDKVVNMHGSAKVLGPSTYSTSWFILKPANQGTGRLLA